MFTKTGRIMLWAVQKRRKWKKKVEITKLYVRSEGQEKIK